MVIVAPTADLTPLAGQDNGLRLQNAITAAYAAGKRLFVVGKGSGDGVWRFETSCTLPPALNGLRIVWEEGTSVSCKGFIYPLLFGIGNTDPQYLAQWPDSCGVQDVQRGDLTLTLRGSASGAGISPGWHVLYSDQSTWGGTNYSRSLNAFELVKVASVSNGVVTLAADTSLYGPQDDFPGTATQRHAASRNYLNNFVCEVKIDNAASGTFTLTVGGQTTAPIAAGATKATVQAALIALSTVGTGGVTVTQAWPVYRITTVNRSITGVSVSVAGLLNSGGTTSGVAGACPVVRSANAVRLVRVPDGQLTQNLSIEGMKGNLYNATGGWGQGMVFGGLFTDCFISGTDCTNFESGVVLPRLFRNLTIYDTKVDAPRTNGAGGGYGVLPERGRHLLVSKGQDSKRGLPNGGVLVRHGIITHAMTDMKVEGWDSSSTIDTHGLDDQRMWFKGCRGNYLLGNASYMDGGQDFLIEDLYGSVAYQGDLRGVKIRGTIDVDMGASPLQPFSIAGAPDQYPQDVDVNGASGATATFRYLVGLFRVDVNGDTTKAYYGRLGDFTLQNFALFSRGPSIAPGAFGKITLKNGAVVATGGSYSGNYYGGFKPFLHFGYFAPDDKPTYDVLIDTVTFAGWTGSGNKDNAVATIAGSTGAKSTGTIHLKDLTITAPANVVGGYVNDSSDTLTFVKENVRANGVLMS